MPEDNRRFSRIPFKVHVELIAANTTYAADEISNLSVGGCLLPVSEHLESGTPCQVKIILDATDSDVSVTVEGTVVRRVREGLAIQFTRIDPASLFHLQNIIRYNAPDADAIEDEIIRHPGVK